MQQRELRTSVNNSFVELIRNSNKPSQSTYKVINISRGGLCFESADDDFELNEVIQLNLIINKQSIHKANARLCYRNLKPNEQPLFGLSFLDKFIDNALINKHINQ